MRLCICSALILLRRSRSMAALASGMFPVWQTGISCDEQGLNEDRSVWDTSNVTNMREMSQGAAAFNQPSGDWDVSKMANMKRMFHRASSFNQPLGDWDVSNNMVCMLLYGCSIEPENEPYRKSKGRKWWICAEWRVESGKCIYIRVVFNSIGQ